MDKRRTCAYGGYGVDLKLEDARNTERVCWINGNSYCIVEDAVTGTYETSNYKIKVALVSINGIGEIRWKVTRWADHDERKAAEYFRLDPIYDHVNGSPLREEEEILNV